MYVARSTVYKSHMSRISRFEEWYTKVEERLSSSPRRIQTYWRSRAWYAKIALIASGVVVAWTALAIAIVIAVSIADVGEPGKAEVAPTTTDSAPNGTTSGPSPSTTTSGQGAESQACGNLPASTDRNACHDSYFSCSLGAKAKVRAYYSGTGASLDTIATHYAKGTYGADPLGGWQAGYGGCLAALQDEYDRLYR